MGKVFVLLLLSRNQKCVVRETMNLKTYVLIHLGTLFVEATGGKKKKLESRKKNAVFLQLKMF